MERRRWFSLPRTPLLPSLNTCTSCYSELALSPRQRSNRVYSTPFLVHQDEKAWGKRNSGKGAGKSFESLVQLGSEWERAREACGTEKIEGQHGQFLLRQFQLVMVREWVHKHKSVQPFTHHCEAPSHTTSDSFFSAFCQKRSSWVPERLYATLPGTPKQSQANTCVTEWHFAWTSVEAAQNSTESHTLPQIQALNS